MSKLKRGKELVCATPHISEDALGCDIHMYLATPYHRPAATATTDAPSAAKLPPRSETLDPEDVKASQSAYAGNIHFNVKSVCERLQIVLVQRILWQNLARRWKTYGYMVEL